jgi:hypothetical protein
MSTSDLSPLPSDPHPQTPRPDSTAGGCAEVVCLDSSRGLDEFLSETTAAPAPLASDPVEEPIGDSTEPEVQSDSKVLRPWQPRATEAADDRAALSADSLDPIDSLKLENKLLRDAASTFGALAERLTRRLNAERLDQDGAPLPAGPVTLVDVIESGDGVNWREAVGIVYRLCLVLKESAKQTPILLEPRNIEITSTGDVRVIPGQTSGDPLVVQLGRLLRRMLSDVSTPPELRLLIAQATFELPIFESVDDLARALRQLDHLEDPASVRAAFVRATQPTALHAVTTHQEEPESADRDILPVRRARRNQRGLRASEVRETFFHVAGGVLAGVLIGLAIVLGWALSQARSGRETAAQAAVSVPPAEITSESGVAPATAVDVRKEVAPSIQSSTAVQPVSRPIRPERESARRVASPAIGGTRDAVAAVPPGPSVPPRAAARVMAAAAPEDLAGRAVSLMAEGKAGEAEIVFDALVLTYPLYDPGTDALTPESLAAFRKSRQTLLPNIAARDYGRAKAALEAGDVDGALDLGRQVSGMLDHLETSPPPDLAERVRRLVSDATAIRSSAELMVYNRGDADVVPPRPLSRQFPAAPPDGVPPHRIGVLDIVVGKKGDVEIVKLHTPLNRYHERMIVSAAKAWRYRPALRDGQPVRFRLSITINLPESGT